MDNDSTTQTTQLSPTDTASQIDTPKESLANRPRTDKRNTRNDTGTVEGTDESAMAQNGSTRSGRTRGLLDPAEAGRRSGAARRARAAARAARLEESRLTTRQRLAIVMSELSLADMRNVRDALLVRAQSGDEKAVNALARLLDQSFGRATPAPNTIEENELATWEQMTPAQRAAIRADLLRQYELDGRSANDASDPRDDSQTKEQAT